MSRFFRADTWSAKRKEFGWPKCSLAPLGSPRQQKQDLLAVLELPAKITDTCQRDFFCCRKLIQTKNVQNRRQVASRKIDLQRHLQYAKSITTCNLMQITSLYKIVKNCAQPSDQNCKYATKRATMIESKRPKLLTLSTNRKATSMQNNFFNSTSRSRPH